MEEKNLIFNERGIPDSHYFVYKNQNYPIKFSFFKHSSNYFLKNKERLKKTKYIQLVNESIEKNTNFSEDSIKTFIKFIQCEQVELNEENAFCLNYLSNIYDVPNLNYMTNEYISNHKQNYALQFLFLHQDDESIDTSQYETIISNKIDKYIIDDQLLNINLPILQRIFLKYKQLNSKPSETAEIDNKIIEFFFKYLDKYGQRASILFNLIEFNESTINAIDNLIENYSNVFDFSFLNFSVLKTMHDEIHKHKNRERELESSIVQIKTKYEQQLKDQKASDSNEINDIKNKLMNKETEMNQLMKEKETEINKLMKEKEIEINKLMKEKDIEINKLMKEKDIEIRKLSEQLNSQKIENDQLKLKYNEIEQQIKQKQEVNTFSGSSNSNFDGIINYLNNKSNSIIFSASSIFSKGKNFQPSNISLFNDQSQSFFSNNLPNSWICLDFKERQVMPTGYKMRTVNWGVIGHHPRSWRFEGSNDNISWTTLDEESNCTYTKGDGLIHYFNIKYPTSTKFRYLRIFSTGPNWTKNTEVNHLIIDSLEIYGKLFE